MLAPVLRLAAAVDRDPPDLSLQRIADQHATDEVGVLSSALVRYRRRSELAIEREMLFSADAGHELRTPLCVLHNGLELMGETQPGSARLQRMRASADEIATLLDALLLAGRSEEGQVTEPSSLELCAVIEMAPAVQGHASSRPAPEPSTRGGDGETDGRPSVRARS